MPPFQLICIILGSVLVAVWLLRALRRSQEVWLSDEADVLAQWQRSFPDLVPYQVEISAQKKSALLHLPVGMGLLCVKSDGRFARVIGTNFIRSISADRQGLILTLNDYASPKVILPLHASEAKHWYEMLAPFKMGAGLQLTPA